MLLGALSLLLSLLIVITLWDSLGRYDYLHLADAESDSQWRDPPWITELINGRAITRIQISWLLGQSSFPHTMPTDKVRVMSDIFYMLIRLFQAQIWNKLKSSLKILNLSSYYSSVWVKDYSNCQRNIAKLFCLISMYQKLYQLLAGSWITYTFQESNVCIR